MNPLKQLKLMVTLRLKWQAMKEKHLHLNRKSVEDMLSALDVLTITKGRADIWPGDIDQSNLSEILGRITQDNNFCQVHCSAQNTEYKCNIVKKQFLCPKTQKKCSSRYMASGSAL